MEYSGDYQKEKDSRLSARFWESFFIYFFATLVVIFLFFAVNTFATNSYDVEYVPVVMKEGDTLYGVISEVNESYDERYNIMDLVYLARQENNLSDALVLKGKSYLIPKLIE